MNIAVCEDTFDDALHLIDFIRERYPGEDKARITYFCTGTELIEAISQKQIYDLIFLDIMLPVINGIDTAREIRKYDTSVMIAFVTYAVEYAVQGYEVDAVCFLVKPLRKIDLKKVFDKLEARISLHGETINVITGVDRCRLPVSDILFIEKQGRKTFIHMLDGTVHVTRHLLRELMDMLQAYPLFIEPYKAFIVHFTHIRAIKRSEMQIYMRNGAVIPISRNRMKAVLDGYMRLVGDEV